MDLGIGISEDVPLETQRGFAVDVETAGFRSLWTNEARGRDALLTCLTWGRATTQLEVGTGVLPIWTRSPAQLAMAAATIQEDLGDRLLLGVGVSHPGTMGPWHGAQYRSPLAAAREHLTIVRRLTTGDESDVDGEVFSSHGFELQVTPRPDPARLYLAAMGPRMLALAGEVADGVLLNWSDPDEVGRSRERVLAGGHGTEIASYVRVAVDEDREAARRALAAELGRYCALPAYADHFRRQGHGGAVDAVKAAYKRGGSSAVADALGDDVLLDLGWYGTPDDDPAPTLERYAAAGLDHLVARVVVVSDVASAVAAAIEVLGSGLTT